MFPLDESKAMPSGDDPTFIVAITVPPLDAKDTGDPIIGTERKRKAPSKTVRKKILE